MRIPGLGWVLLLAAIGVAVWGTMRLLDKRDDASEAVVNAITTPIDMASRVSAEANVRQALAATQVYFTENGSYAGISAMRLQRIDRAVSPTVEVVPVGANFCLVSIVGRVSVHAIGGSPEIVDGPCPSSG